MLKKMLFIVALLYSFSLHAQKAPEAKQVLPQWERASPQSQGINAQKMQEALEYLEAKSFGDGIEEVLIIKNGKRIYSGDSVAKTRNITPAQKYLPARCWAS